MTEEKKAEIRNQLINILEIHYEESDPPMEFGVGKDMLTSCSPDEDMRLIVDTSFDVFLINRGYKYIPLNSTSEKLAILKYSVCPIDYTSMHFATKILLAGMGCNPDCIDKKLCLYYDETNNVKKFRLNEEKHKFNVSPESIFVLGGIEANDTISFEELRDLLKLQSNITEVKSHNIYDGALPDCLKSDKLESILDLLIEKQWHIHFQSLNLLYWSIADIIDTVNVLRSLDPDLNRALKTMLYYVMKGNQQAFFDIVLKYRYPDIKDTDIKPFMLEVADLCRKYSINGCDPSQSFVKQILVWGLVTASKQDEAVLIQGEKPLELLKELSQCYRCEVATWLNSNIVFDNESDITFALKQYPVSIKEAIVDNYVFVDSKSNPMVQLSDVVVGIVARYLAFIDQEGLYLPKVVTSKFNEKQVRIFGKLNRALMDSRKFNDAFFHQTTCIEYHGLLNKYVDMYGV